MDSKFILIFVLALVGISSAQKPKYKCDKAKMDKCGATLTMIADSNFVFPTTMDEMNKRCKEIKPLERCVKDYSKNCLSSASGQAISVLTFSITRTNKNYCTNTKRKNQMISFGACANRNLKFLYDTMMDMNKAFHAAKVYKDKALRVPLACCNYYKFKETVMARVQVDCTADQGAEIEKLIDGYAHDVLNLLCGDYTEESDKCKGLTPKTPKWTQPVAWKVFIGPLAEILDSLEG